jgi:hypothetical protein
LAERTRKNPVFIPKMNKSSPKLVLFSEVQRFRQAWVWIPVIFLIGVSWYFFLRQIVSGKPTGTSPAPDAVIWIIWAVFGIFFPIFFLKMGMITEVREDGIRIHFSPFYRRFIKLIDIQGFEVKEYHPFRDFGGWGVRWSFKNGMVYNVSGNRGVQLKLKDGKRALIGSQQPELLASVLGGILQHTRR